MIKKKNKKKLPRKVINVVDICDRYQLDNNCTNYERRAMYYGNWARRRTIETGEKKTYRVLLLVTFDTKIYRRFCLETIIIINFFFRF